MAAQWPRGAGNAAVFKKKTKSQSSPAQDVKEGQRKLEKLLEEERPRTGASDYRVLVSLGAASRRLW